jgi:Thioredoxin
MDNEMSLGLVLRDINLASSLNINGTPTIFINGHRLQGVKDADQLRELIAEARKESKSQHRSWLLRRRRLLRAAGAGNLLVAERIGVLRDAFEESLGDFLTLIRALEELFVVRVGDKTDLGEDGRHGGADQDDEGRLAHAAIARADVHLHRARPEGGLDFLGEVARFFELGLQHGFMKQIVEVGDGARGGGVFARGEIETGLVGGEIEVVGFDAGGAGLGRRVGVDGDEQIGFLVVGDAGAIFERNENIV